MWTLQEHIGRVVNAGPREAAAALDEDEDGDKEGAGRQRALQEVAEGCATPLSFLSPLKQRNAGFDLCKVTRFKRSQHRSLVLSPVLSNLSTACRYEQGGEHGPEALSSDKAEDWGEVEDAEDERLESGEGAESWRAKDEGEGSGAEGADAAESELQFGLDGKEGDVNEDGADGVAEVHSGEDEEAWEADNDAEQGSDLQSGEEEAEERDGEEGDDADRKLPSGEDEEGWGVGAGKSANGECS